MARLGSRRRAATRHPSVVRTVACVALASVGLTAGCASVDPDDRATTRVLQSVAVGLESDGAVSTVDGTAVFLDEVSGVTTSAQTAYAPGEVVGELPVRVTTQYRTADGAGSDLGDLVGYSGRVQIDVTLESLTVSPASVRFDAQGLSREASALVGVPLSVAASVTLDGVATSSVIFAPDDPRTTNGVVSSASDGDAIVQWAILLAPPQSEATVTLRVVADVADFALPSLDIAVEAGLHTDLTFEGVVASAFDRGSKSELAMQERTISLVSEVNDVLIRAGSTITDVRKNLDETSASLGVHAAQQLASSATALTDEMAMLGQQIAALDQELAGSVTSARSEMSSQLLSVVSSMHAMLGDTTGTPPRLISGDGCSAVVVEGDPAGTLFETFLLLAGKLAGYAEASEGCRDEIDADLANLLGPETPTVADCADAASMTCALFGAEQTVLASLSDLVKSGARIASTIDATPVVAAITAHTDLGAALGDIDAKIAEIEGSASDPAAWTALQGLVGTASQEVDTLSALRSSTVAPAIEQLQTGPDSVLQRYRDLAASVCALDGADPAAIEAIRASILDTDCQGQPRTTPQDTLTDQAVAQIEAWETVDAALDLESSSSALHEIQSALTNLNSSIEAVLQNLEEGQTVALRALVDVKTLLGEAADQHGDLGGQLATIQTDQSALVAAIGSEFSTAADTAKSRVANDLDTHEQALTRHVNANRGTIVRSYNEIIAGLSSDSNGVVADGGAQIGDQKAKIESTRGAAAASLDERTTGALARIHAGTAASSRDIESASALLADSLTRVIVDLGDPTVGGSGILGAMSTSAAKSDTADYQLALASQRATGYSNLRAEDIARIMLRQAQFHAALESAAALPAFHLEVPAGATSQTIYLFSLAGDAR